MAALDKQMRILIIDGHAFAYRAFFAIRDLSSPSGRPTNAIYGFINMFEKFEAKVLPTHTVVVWDGGLDEGRIGRFGDELGDCWCATDADQCLRVDGRKS